MSFIKTDEEIVSLYKTGNKKIFKELVDRYTPPLYNFSARLIGKDNAPDMVQEVFIKVWKNISNFNPSKASLKTWIFAIAKNSITDFLRKRKCLNFSDLEYEEDPVFSENIVDENILPDEALQRLQNSSLLDKLLNQLPPQYKTVLILHYQEEMTFNEIGKILEKPLNTVKSYHHRAILELRKTI
ncbi:sigma-70 family RNA polymerase sigma factor [Patescibacteria group bacterium]|nr:sigma-70 family RNA polymerase sigma factor [Patescibacteria group bacterium]